MNYNNSFGGINPWVEHWKRCAVAQRKKGRKCPLQFALSTYTKKPTHADLLENIRAVKNKEIRLLEKKYNELKKEYRSSDDLIAVLENEIDERGDNAMMLNYTNKEYNKLGKKYTNLQEQNKDLKKGHQYKDIMYKDLNKKYRDCDNLNDVLQENYDEKEDEYEILNKKYQDLKDLDEKTKQHFYKLQLDYDKANNEISRLDNELIECNVNNSEMIKLYEKSVDKYNKLANEHKDILKSNIELHNKYIELTEFHSQSSRDFTDVMHDYEFQKIESENALRASEKILEIKNVAFDQLENERKHMEILLNTLQNEKDILIAKLFKTNGELEEKITIITQQNLTRDEMTDEINKLIKEKDDQELDMSLLLNKIENSKKEIVKEAEKIYGEYSEFIEYLDKVDEIPDVEQVSEEELYPEEEIRHIPQSTLKELRREPLEDLEYGQREYGESDDEISSDVEVYIEPKQIKPKVIKAKLIKAKPKQTRKFTDDELINIFNSRKPITKKLGRSMSKNDLGFLHSKCLNRKIAQWTGFQKEVLREGYNDCIKALK